MKRIPETFQLDENDIKAAINLWLNHPSGGSVEDGEFNVALSVKNSTQSIGGGMNDRFDIQTFSAVAVRKE